MNLVPEDIKLLYVPPFPDESLTSWMHRLVNSHFTDLRTYFADRIEPGVLRRTDFDLLQNRSLLAQITRFTPLDVEELINLTLCRSQMAPFETIVDRSFVPWLLPRPSKHPKSFGLQICPSCWSKESIAYHRIQWRLSLFFFCSTCGVYLLDHCPSCHHPINHVQTDYLRLVEDPLNLQRWCFYCKWDLSLSDSKVLSRKDLETANRVLELFENIAYLPCSTEDCLVVLHYFTQRTYSSINVKTTDYTQYKKGIGRGSWK